MHEVDVLGQRLAQRARHRLDPPVGDEPAPDLRLDHVAELAQAALVLLAGEPGLEIALVAFALAALALALLGRALHEPARERVVVQLPQRPVQVVGPADGPARLHAREARDGHRRDLAELVLVHVHERGHQHLGELFVAHALAGAATALLAGNPAGFVRVAGLAARLTVTVDAAGVEREVDVEDGVERAAVPEALHQRRREHLAERVPFGQRDLLDAAHRVEVLGHRDREPRRPQLVDEALQDVEHHAVAHSRRDLQLVAGHRVRTASRSARGHPRDAGSPVPIFGVSTSSLRALAMSVWYFSRTCSVSSITCGVDRAVAQVQQRAGPVDRLRDRRRLLDVQRADRTHDLRDLLGERVVDLGHAHPHDLLLALEIRVVDVQVEAPPLQRLRELTGVVRRQQHDRALPADDGAELRDRDLEVREHLEQQRLGLDLDPVDLVDEQHDRLLGPDRLEQRPGEQERLGEDVRLDRLPVASRARGPPGSAAAASCSSTRRAPWTRRGPRSTGAG